MVTFRLQFELQRKPHDISTARARFQTKAMIRLDHGDHGPDLSASSVSLMQLTKFVLNVTDSDSNLLHDSF